MTHFTTNNTFILFDINKILNFKTREFISGAPEFISGAPADTQL